MRVTWEAKDLRPGLRIGRWDWEMRPLIVLVGDDVYVAVDPVGGVTVSAQMGVEAMVGWLNQMRFVPADFFESAFAKGTAVPFARDRS